MRRRIRPFMWSPPRRPGRRPAGSTFPTPSSSSASRSPASARPPPSSMATIITETDVDQRLALIVASNRVELPPEEMVAGARAGAPQPDRRNAADPGGDAPGDHRRGPRDRSHISIASRAISSARPQDFAAYLRTVGASDRSLKRQIRGELAWQRLQRRQIEPFVTVGEEEVQTDPRPPERLARHRRISRRGNLHLGLAGDPGRSARQCRPHRPAGSRRRLVRRLCAAILGSLDGRGGRRSRLGARRAAARRTVGHGAADAGRLDQRSGLGAGRRFDRRSGRFAPDPRRRSARRAV